MMVMIGPHLTPLVFGRVLERPIGDGMRDAAGTARVILSCSQGISGVSRSRVRGAAGTARVILSCSQGISRVSCSRVPVSAIIQ